MERIVSVHIHSCFASYSSSDVYLYARGFESDKAVKNYISNLEKVHTKFKFDRLFKSSLVDGIKIWYCEDETFCNVRNRLQSFEKTPEFETLVTLYMLQGLVSTTPDILTAYIKASREAEIQKRKKDGYIFCFDFENYKPENIQGGLSDAVFNHKQIKEYIKRNPCGFIGHSVRKAQLDAYIEKMFMKLNPPKYVGCPKLVDVFAVWLTSNDGRHFGDSFEGFSFTEQKKIVKKTLHDIYNYGYIYSLKEHKGSYNSTCELMEKYKHRLIKK